MKLKLIIFTLFLFTMQTTTIFKFDKSTDISGWSVVDDGVMGGRSAGKFHLNNEGNAVFEGRVSLENNGGFSSVRYDFEEISTKGFTKVLLKVKGDGKTYQFRVKHKSKDYYSYIVNFQPSEEWGTIELTLSEMYPAFRGTNLDIPNYDRESIEEIAFLIGNKKAENFKLEIESIILK